MCSARQIRFLLKSIVFMVCEHEYMNSICTLPQLLRLVMALTPPNHNANNFEIKSPDDESSGFKIMHYNIESYLLLCLCIL